MINEGFKFIAHNVRVFAKAGNSLLVCPEQMLIEKLKLKITTKSQITNVQPKLKLIANYSRR